MRAIQAELRSGDLHPERAREHVLTLTSLLGNCLDEVQQADLAYHQVLLRELDADGPANRAKIRAQVSPEYQRQREAHNTHTLMLEMIRGLKAVLRSLEEEMRLSR